MRVLVLGSGGRESALAWALQRSSHVAELVASPGNPGIGRFATVVPTDISDPVKVVALARELRPDLVVVGPEAPLVAGVADALRGEGIDVFGPGAAAARIEGSKAFAKELMERAGIATAQGRAFDSVPSAVAYMDRLGPPFVIKADGLAAGKGVVVTDDRSEAITAIEERIAGAAFGAEGRPVVIEEYLDGPEVSLIAFCDGTTVVSCEPAQDYKRVDDADTGPNTGGMGSYSPVPACPPEVATQITEELIRPTVHAMRAAGTAFIGALYAGLALTSRGPKVIEFNARFGDPETQALIPRLQSDFAETCAACSKGELEGMELQWSGDACVAVVLASGGYPGDHATGFPIHGIERAERLPGVQVFYAGTALEDGRLVTAGGRVVAVSALANTFRNARAKAYEAAGHITFEGRHMRTDIAARAELAEATT
jgi:phosphoribosylamine---glycine ligase